MEAKLEKARQEMQSKVEEVEEKVVEAQEISSQDSTRMDALLNHRLRHLLQLRRLLPWRTMDGALFRSPRRTTVAETRGRAQLHRDLKARYPKVGHGLEQVQKDLFY